MGSEIATEASIATAKATLALATTRSTLSATGTEAALVAIALALLVALLDKDFGQMLRSEYRLELCTVLAFDLQSLLLALDLPFLALEVLFQHLLCLQA